MEVKGKVKLVNATEEVGTKGFKKRLIVVETEETYSQCIPIEFVQDKCSLLDNVQIGQDITVHINLRGSEYNGRYYVQLQGWKLESSAMATAVQTLAASPLIEDPASDLPF